MVLITGDVHRDFNAIIDAFSSGGMLADVAEADKEKGEKTTLIITGDVGINFYLDSRDVELKRRLQEFCVGHNLELLCVHGNHEERPGFIDGYKLEEYKGGLVYKEPNYTRLLFAKCGNIYNINGLKTLVVGGALSVDKIFRIAAGWPWFPLEQPTKDIRLETELNLEEREWKVDVIITHTCPVEKMPVDMLVKGQKDIDHSTEEWLQEIYDKTKFKRWYCGHFHCDRLVDNLRFMYHDIIEFGR